MALYELILRGRFAGQETINRWNYVSSGTPAAILGSYGLLAALGFVPTGSPAVYQPNTMFAKIKAMLSTGASFVETEARNVYDPTDFYLQPYVTTQAGVITGESMSPTVAFGFRTNRVRTDIRRATKRFAGVPESGVGTEGIVTSAQLTLMQSLADEMSEIQTWNDEGNVLSFSPAIVSKQEYTTPKGKKAYRYYPTLEEQLTHIALGMAWQPYSSTRTQTSRQYGRGV